MPLQPSQLRNALATVMETDIGKDIVTAGMVKDLQCEGDDISIEIQLSSNESPLRETIRKQIEAALRSAGQEMGEGVGAVKVKFTADVRTANERVRDDTSPLPNVKKLLQLVLARVALVNQQLQRYSQLDLRNGVQRWVCLMVISMDLL